VFYVVSVTPDGGGLERIFVHMQEKDGRVAVMSADRGVQREDEKSGERILVLENGRRYDGQPGQQDFRMVSFAEHGVRFVPKLSPHTQSEIGMTPTSKLVGAKNPAEIAELQKRISTPISVVLLALLAVPLSYLTPRQGRYGKVVVGIFIYAIYANLLGAAQVWTAEARIPPWLGMWWVHGLLAVLGCVLIMMRNTGGRVRKRVAASA
jgi:lipopolysaccharide export system permease protein